MSWRDLDPEVRARATANLTEKQLNVLMLYLAGCSQRRIATMLGLSRTTVKDHLRIALDAIAKEAA